MTKFEMGYDHLTDKALLALAKQAYFAYMSEEAKERGYSYEEARKFKDLFDRYEDEILDRGLELTW